MNHMGNEFYFSGYQSEQAPWRFHEEDGLREYELKFRKEPGGAFWLAFFFKEWGALELGGVSTCKSTFLKKLPSEMMLDLSDLSIEAIGARVF